MFAAMLICTVLFAIATVWFLVMAWATFVLSSGLGGRTEWIMVSAFLIAAGLSIRCVIYFSPFVIAIKG